MARVTKSTGSSSRNATGSSKQHSRVRSSSSGIARDAHSYETKPRSSFFTQKSQGSKQDTHKAFTRQIGFRNPLWCYHGFIASVAFLTIFGVVMVFSSSSVKMVSLGAAPWSQAMNQAIYCVLGIMAAVVCMLVPAQLWPKLSRGVLALSLFTQSLIFTPLGIEVNGNKGWIGLRGVFTIQPSEIIKFALCLWLPQALAKAGKKYNEVGYKAYFQPIGWYAGSLLLVLAGKDMGTGLIIVAIGACAFILGGVPKKLLAGGFFVAVLGVVALVITSPNRIMRILAAYRDCSDTDMQNVCFQSIHAQYAIASGGLTGVGLGNSREKWNYLPEAHNDFIFAIISEETGFIGAMLVIILFIILGLCMVSMALQAKGTYVSLVLMCITIWIVGQGLINIGVVVGLFPVMGVPLPYVSAGGSSLIMCLAAAGAAASMMRANPQVRAELQRA